VTPPSFTAGGAKPIHLDDIFILICKVDHAELLQAGHSQHEDLLARKKERVTDASVEFGDATERVLLEGKPGSGKTTLVKKLALDWARSKTAALDLVFVLPLRSVQHVKAY